MATYSVKDFENIMKKNGYVRQSGRGKGSHIVYKNGNRTISIGHHYNKMIIRRLIKEYQLTE